MDDSDLAAPLTLLLSMTNDQLALYRDALAADRAASPHDRRCQILTTNRINAIDQILIDRSLHEPPAQ